MGVVRTRPARLMACLLAGALAVGFAATGSARAGGAVQPRCGQHRPADRRAAYLCARPGDLIDVTLGELHPTQAVLGYDEVYYKLGRYRSDKDEQAGDVNKRFDDWCETNGQDSAATVSPGARLDDPASFSCTVPVGGETPESIAAMKTVVVGPGGRLYLTDGHHTLTSFLESPDGGARMHIRLRVTGNLSRLSPSAFWQTMQANRWTWLRDENNRPIPVSRLPQHLGLANFHDDRYRGLVYFTRDIGYAVPDDAAEFLEFYWGTWLRGRYDLNDSDLTDPAVYLDLVKQASQAMAALADTDIVAGDATAADLGKMADWNDGKKETGGEFAKLAKPITDPKPGKLAFALDFRADVTKPPACGTTITGPHARPLYVSAGVLCLDRAQQTGPVTVGPGATLVSAGATIAGPLRSTRARQVYVCGTTITGGASIDATTGPVQLGGNGCTANSIGGPLRLSGNTGGVLLAGNDLNAALSCSGNQPAPQDAGRPNRIRGKATGQCAPLSSAGS